MTTKTITGTLDTRWDLGFLYSGLNDPRLGADVATLVEMSQKFNATHKGRLAETLASAISDYADISMLQNKIMLYLYLSQSTNVADTAIKSKIAEVERIITHASGEHLTFFELELVALDEATLQKCYSDSPVVARHRPWIEQCRVFKPHLLASLLSLRLPSVRHLDRVRGVISLMNWRQILRQSSKARRRR